MLALLLPSERGRSYVGETGRPLAVLLHQHRHNLKEGLVQYSKLAQRVYEESHRASWDVVGFWKLEATTGVGNTRNGPIRHT
jgi:hypothetical protein